MRKARKAINLAGLLCSGSNGGLQAGSDFGVACEGCCTRQALYRGDVFHGQDQGGINRGWHKHLRCGKASLSSRRSVLPEGLARAMLCGRFYGRLRARLLEGDGLRAFADRDGRNGVSSAGLNDGVQLDDVGAVDEVRYLQFATHIVRPLHNPPEAQQTMFQ